MWGPRKQGQRTVTCIACGDAVRRSDAREYDKYGDRWDRDGKEFEHLCKDCYRDLCHQPRAELEGLLVEINAGTHSQSEFLSWYCALVDERYGSPSEHERER
ncbi:DUF7562 family protein [Halalkalicoccus jeotgali]|uniref:Small CPxCG-related zinc finger protein n=1 Tax=Halalkalicoccus jeotgali (strain DSM 18796 / CECT 7217 / JCM 14584 / KCTC 4019 / B3) TaxID=795797 RepID=D8J9R8_HALJB|nr:hypothetical protein [Halalkalicoccus jeotgali]ADJ16407.1 hypothetical protein HacjB3_15140 [Halalkalicoccus jeotgali B3]ELY37141.1 hypothetical protein C497_10368 [Halalkalicoccus jeotgali B3]